MAMVDESGILWRHLEEPGHEHCRLFERGASWHVEGSAAFAHEGAPCRLDYTVICNERWQTVTATVRGWVGDRRIDIEISVDELRHWWIDGTEVPDVAGSDDVDLNFSPSTNTLPIRRLKLEIGQEAPVRAAFLPFPSFAPEPLEQVYRRLDENKYRYESAGGEFVRELEVNEAGLVTRYPGLFEAEVG
jgi:hypothetical protein